MFPYRESFYRVFSQTNLSIANSLLVNASANGQKPSDQIQSTALSLIQQSINVARAATTISPFNTLEWQNLAGIYRALIGFGQNAESFSVASMQQAIALDPANPQEYIVLGGIYYQLGDYDNAIRQFQLAINAKPDLANAYYNLGHSYEQKKDYQSALTNYLAVKTLVAQDKTNLDRINGEINALENKIGNVGTTQTNNNLQPATGNQEPLNVQQSQTQLPAVTPQVPIPAPQASPTPAK
jgi:tetratricopeptide (TPR) repeat protein